MKVGNKDNVSNLCIVNNKCTKQNTSNLFKINNKNTGTLCQTCSKSTIKTLEQSMKFFNELTKKLEAKS